MPRTSQTENRGGRPPPMPRRLPQRDRGANGATSPPSNSNLQSGGGPGGLTTSPHHVPENGGAPNTALPAPRARPYREPLFLLAWPWDRRATIFAFRLLSP